MARDVSALANVFYPRGTAVIGSASEGKLGYELIRQMVEGGYEHVYAVNPRAEGALGAPGYDAVAKIERPVDLAVIASPAATVPAVLEDCGSAGVKAAAIITAGFSEIGNDEAERQVVRAAERVGVRFVGPNCAGIVNTAHSLYPTLETRPPRGSVAVVAQSGAVGGIVLAWAKAFGLGISKFVSYGNGADLNEIDLLHYLADDPETKVVALYIESTDDGRAFMEAVRACTRNKPVVVIKAGRTGAGQRATLSHTGSMAGADAVYDAALAQCGAIRVHTVEEMFDFCKAYSSLNAHALSKPHTGHGGGQGPGRPRDGRRLRIGIVTNSGGPGVLAADRAEEVGLDVVEPSAAVQEALRDFLPGHCALRNPIDLTVEGTGEWYRRTLESVLDEYDAAVAINVSTPYLDSVALARGVADAAASVDKPLVAAFLPEQIVADAVDYLEGRGVPNFATGERAVAALGLVDQVNRIPPQPPLPQDWDGGLRPRALPDDEMLEPTAMAWLEENGIPVPEFRFVAACGAYGASGACGERSRTKRSRTKRSGTKRSQTTGPSKGLPQRPSAPPPPRSSAPPLLRSAVAEACREIGYPVAMKVVSPGILHKSDVGGVVLDVNGDDEAHDAFDALASTARGRGFRGVIIYPMIDDAQELLLGLSRDPQFGPVVVFGLGGIYTEVLRDIVLRVAPIDREQAADMVGQIKSFALLEGVRGEPRRDLEALVDVLVRFSQLPFLYPDISEVDLNPVFLFEQGRGLVVGDVRVIVNNEFKESES